MDLDKVFYSTVVALALWFVSGIIAIAVTGAFLNNEKALNLAGGIWVIGMGVIALYFMVGAFLNWRT